MSSSQTPLSGGFVLLAAALSTLAGFWMLRSGPIGFEPWFAIAFIWVSGAVIRIFEIGGQYE